MPLCTEYQQARHWSCSMAPHDSNVQAGLRLSGIKRILLEAGKDPQREMLERLGLPYGTVQ